MGDVEKLRSRLNKIVGSLVEKGITFESKDDEFVQSVYLLEDWLKRAVEREYGEPYETVVPDFDIFEEMVSGMPRDRVVEAIIGHMSNEYLPESMRRVEAVGERDEILDEDRAITEGTSNFRSFDNFPLLVFYTYDEIEDGIYNDPEYPNEEQFTTDLGGGDFHVDYDALEDARAEFAEKIWDDLNLCVLDYAEVEMLENEIHDFNQNTKALASEAYDENEDNLSLEDIKIKIESGYYEANQIYIENESHFKYLEPKFAEEQIKRFQEFLKKIKDEFRLTELEVAWGPASNGETGYRRVGESKKVNEGFAGWIAIYNGKKFEIKPDQAKDLYGAKKLAIQHFNVPMAKYGSIAIAPAYDDDDDAPAVYAQFESKGNRKKRKKAGALISFCPDPDKSSSALNHAMDTGRIPTAPMHEAVGERDVNKAFADFLEYIEFELVKPEDGGERSIDGDVVDAPWGIKDMTGTNLGDIESDRFATAKEILDRCDIYLDDYFLVDAKDEDDPEHREYASLEDMLKDIPETDFRREMVDVLVNHIDEVDLEKVYEAQEGGTAPKGPDAPEHDEVERHLEVVSVDDDGEHAIETFEMDEREDAIDYAKEHPEATKVVSVVRTESGEYDEDAEVVIWEREEECIHEDYGFRSDNARRAWELNEIVSSMNDERAYMDWINLWPDGCSKEECEGYFSEDMEFEELEEVFRSIYETYHGQGLYKPSKKVSEIAHRYDELLGLEPIAIKGGITEIYNARGMAYYEYPKGSGFHVRETPSAFVAIDDHGKSIGQSKTKYGAEGIIDAHLGGIHEASTSERRAFRNGGRDYADHVDGKAIARIHDPDERARAIATKRLADRGRLGDRPGIDQDHARRVAQAERSFGRKQASMARAGMEDMDEARRKADPVERIKKAIAKWLKKQGYDDGYEKFFTVSAKPYQDGEGNKATHIQVRNDLVGYYDDEADGLVTALNKIVEFEPYSARVWDAYVWED